MKIESTQFTAADIQQFLREFRELERDLLVQRLEAAGSRLDALRPRLEQLENRGPSDEAGWNANEIVGHLALVSKLYGVLAYRVASGKDTAYDLLEIVRLRDVAGEKAAQEPLEQHLDAMTENRERTLRFLREASVDDLERESDTGIDGLKLKAVDVVRLALVSHLEQHLDQLEKALA